MKKRTDQKTENYTKNVFSDTLKKILSSAHGSTVNVTDIVDGSGYSRRTFYNHFIDLDDLALWTFQKDALSHFHGPSTKPYQERFIRIYSRASPQKFESYIRQRAHHYTENSIYYYNLTLMQDSQNNSLTNFVQQTGRTYYQSYIFHLVGTEKYWSHHTEYSRLASFFSQSLLDEITRKMFRYRRWTDISEDILADMCISADTFGKQCISGYLVNTVPN